MDPGPSERPLSLEEYERYGRQMILPSCGLGGQVALKKAVVGVVGAGGLGCPVLQYLAGAGVGDSRELIEGTIHLFDHDTVSISNLHRQILHTTERVGMNKAESAKLSMMALNPLIQVIAHDEAITPTSAISLLRPVEVLVDCTDRPLTRYLLNDAAVRLGVPLVSGAAIAGAGQWAVYGGNISPPVAPVKTNTPNGVVDRKGKRRACYRCIWPSVLPGSHGRCEDLGVWGFVTGMIGVGMASEVIKIITGRPEPLLHLYHLGGNPLIRTIRMKGPSDKCVACGPNASITNDLDSLDYETFCGGGPDVNEETGSMPGQEGHRISAKDLQTILSGKSSVLVVDTRSPTEFEICAIPSSTNVPLDELLKDPSRALALDPSESSHGMNSEQEVVFVCRQGNDSQLAAAALRSSLESSSAPVLIVRDMRGGLRAWSRTVDPNFPIY